MTHSSVERTPGPATPFVFRWPVQLFLLPLVRLALLLIAGGRLDWLWGWLLIAAHLFSSLATYLLVHDPALIAEREQADQVAKEWDRRLVRLYGLAYVLTLIVGGLDAGRFGWSPRLPVIFHLAGLLLLTATVVLSVWSMRVNTFFSAFVRIQEERRQQVISTGPYAWIRHPGNLGMALWILGVVLTVGSLWALIPAGLGTALVVRRTQREDQTLQTELPGYTDYAKTVPYRLVPGLW